MKFIKLLILFIIISLIFVFLNYQSWLIKPKSMLLGALSPIQHFAYSATNKLWSFFNLISLIPELNQENEELKKDNKLLLARVVELEEISYENNQLRKQLDLEEKHDQQLLLANITGQGEIIFINKGQNHGVKIGMPIIAPGSILIGRVFETLDSVSKVQPIISSQEPINVLIQPSRTHGVVKSKDGTSLFIEFIPLDLEIQAGDIVITSSSSSQFPQGLLIGLISDTQESLSSLEQTALISPLVNLKNLEKVFVILGE